MGGGRKPMLSHSERAMLRAGRTKPCPGPRPCGTGWGPVLCQCGSPPCASSRLGGCKEVGPPSMQTRAKSCLPSMPVCAGPSARRACAMILSVTNRGKFAMRLGARCVYAAGGDCLKLLCRKSRADRSVRLRASRDGSFDAFDASELPCWACRAWPRQLLWLTAEGAARSLNS